MSQLLLATVTLPSLGKNGKLLNLRHVKLKCPTSLAAGRGTPQGLAQTVLRRSEVGRAGQIGQLKCGIGWTVPTGIGSAGGKCSARYGQLQAGAYCLLWHLARWAYISGCSGTISSILGISPGGGQAGPSKGSEPLCLRTDSHPV